MSSFSFTTKVEAGGFFILQELSNCCCPPAKPGVYPREITHLESSANRLTNERGPLFPNAMNEIGGSSRRHNVLSQLGWFSAVGVVAFGVNAGLVALTAPSIGPAWAQSIAFPVAATTAWLLNRRYTFVASGAKLHFEWLKYIFANSVGWIINNTIYFILVYHLPLVYAHPWLAVAAGSLFGLGANFFLSRTLVFKRKGV